MSVKTHLDPREAFEEMGSILDMVRWTVSQFNQYDLSYGHGTENSWDEAFNLVLSSLHLPPDVDKSVLSACLTTREKKLLSQQIAQRIEERIPVPYLVKEAWFSGLNFYVDERVIIPRSPIAELIEEEFSPWVDGTHVRRVLDLCTGSGCIAVSCALAFPDAEVDAVDISTDALAVAKINVERYSVEDTVNLVESDLFNELQGRRYDIIITNPPYVSTEEMEDLPLEYSHEPRLALAAGTDGLDAARRILEQAAEFLTPQGILVMEVGYSQDALEAAYPNLPFTWLQFEAGGEGVCLLTAEELHEHLASFS